jgi:hypothetical protein
MDSSFGVLDAFAFLVFAVLIFVTVIIIVSCAQIGVVEAQLYPAISITGTFGSTARGDLLPPANAPQPPTPGLPGPRDIGPTIRPPEW